MSLDEISNCQMHWNTYPIPPVERFSSGSLRTLPYPIQFLSQVTFFIYQVTHITLSPVSVNLLMNFDLRRPV